MKDVKKSDSNREPHNQQSNALTTRLPIAAAELTENLWYLCTTLLTLLMYTVAIPDPDPDPNPRGGVNYLTLRVQFYANECNEGRDANP